MTAATQTHPKGNGAKLRVGVAGVGYLGRIHARIYAAMPDVELVGVADINEKAAQEIAQQHGCHAYADSRELLGGVDAVSIVVPTVYHSQVAKPFLERGVHMLMEKPIAPTYAESAELVKLAERAGVIFQVGHLERFNAGVMALALRAQNPRFIEVHRIGPFVARATDVDVVTDLMIHDIDIVMSLVRSDIKSVAATGIAVITNHVDIANARIEFENGVSRTRSCGVFAFSAITSITDWIMPTRNSKWCTPRQARAGPSGPRSSPKRFRSRRVRRSTPNWIILSEPCAPELRPWSTATSGWRHCALLSW
jgi:predicted dehydrogenase